MGTKLSQIYDLQVAAAKQNDGDDGGGGLNNLATNQENSPQPLVTLPLFNG